MHHCYHAAAGPFLQWNGLKAWKIYQLVSIKEVATALPATLHARESPLIRTGGRRERDGRGRWKSERGSDRMEREERCWAREMAVQKQCSPMSACFMALSEHEIHLSNWFFLGQTSHITIVSRRFSSLMTKPYWGHQMAKWRQNFIKVCRLYTEKINSDETNGRIGLVGSAEKLYT